MEKQSIILSDGRKMAFTVSGNPSKPAVLFIHGTPLSSLMWHNMNGFNNDAFYRICIDRPGYGDSDYNINGAVDQIHYDIKSLLVHLEVKQVSLIGVSGAGPYMVKCALEIPHLLKSVHLVSCVGPYVKEAIGHMNSNRYLYRMAKIFPGIIRLQNHLITKLILKDPVKFINLGKKKLKGTDYDMLDQNEFAQSLAEVYPDGLKSVTRSDQNPMSDDVIFTANWNIPLESIEKEVHIYWGHEDHSIGDQSAYMCDHIPNAVKHYYKNQGHFLIYKILPDILKKLS